MKKINFITIVFFISISTLFVINMIFWYNATEKEYAYDNFKHTLIQEFHDNPNEFQKNYDYKVENYDELPNEAISHIYQKARKMRFVFLLSVSVPLCFFECLILLGPLFIISSILRKYDKYRLSVDSFRHNEGYFRDLLEEYNPLELSYNNNYNLDDNSLIAMILYLQKKKVLYLKDDKFVINHDGIDNLNKLEKDFIKCSKISDDGKLRISYLKITKLTDQSCITKNLLVKGGIPKKKFIIDLLKAIVLYIVLYAVWNNLNDIYDVMAPIYDKIPPIYSSFVIFSDLGLYILLCIFIYVYPFVTVIRFFILFITINIKQSKKTDLGKEIDYKLSGLKNFIRDFSELDERTKEEIVLWDDYLIYSVLFGDNKKIYSEMKDKIQYT